MFSTYSTYSLGRKESLLLFHCSYPEAFSRNQGCEVGLGALWLELGVQAWWNIEAEDLTFVKIQDSESNVVSFILNKKRMIKNVYSMRKQKLQNFQSLENSSQKKKNEGNHEKHSWTKWQSKKANLTDDQYRVTKSHIEWWSMIYAHHLHHHHHYQNKEEHLTCFNSG